MNIIGLRRNPDNTLTVAVFQDEEMLAEPLTITDGKYTVIALYGDGVHVQTADDETERSKLN